MGNIITKIDLKQKIYEMHQEGWNNAQIARKLGLNSRALVHFHLRTYKKMLEDMQKGGGEDSN